MSKPGRSQSVSGQSQWLASGTRLQQRRARRLLRRGEERKALQLLRESAAREPSGPSYCWLAEAMLRSGKRDDALHALRQALYAFRHESTRGRARTVARWILSLDPTDSSARRVEAKAA
ncbi:MAG: hypothetical protein QM778_24850 [Myxococcales bacterium]